jgi:hypothetical protein
MLAIVWRVADSSIDIDGFIRKFSLDPNRVWFKGEPMPGRVGTYSASGFTLSVGQNGNDLARALEDLRIFLHTHKEAFAALRHRGIVSTIDIGITIGSERCFTRSISISPADLIELGRAGIVLELSAYPCSDEE